MTSLLTYVHVKKATPVGSFTTEDSSGAFQGADEMEQPLLCCCDTTGQEIHPS